MAKEMAKQAGLAAVENLLQAMMPQLLQRIDGLEQKLDNRFTRLEERVGRIEERMLRADAQLDNLRHEFRQDLENKTDQLRDTINELGQRIARLEGKLDVVAGDRRSLDQFIERLVKLEIAQKGRRKAS